MTGCSLYKLIISRKFGELICDNVPKRIDTNMEKMLS